MSTRQKSRTGPGEKRGPKQKIEVSHMALCALVLVRLYRAQRKAAVRAAILFYFTSAEHERPELQVDIFMVRVLKALQRLEAGRRSIHPDLLAALDWRDSAGNTVSVTPQDLAQSVAAFLPK